MLKTPIGTISIVGHNGFSSSLVWGESDKAHVTAAENQLQDYFNKNIQQFDLNIELEGTDYQKKVWDEVAKIPYGCTKTYSEIAAVIGSGPRAVGNAVGANPLPIIIPCHRVVGKNGHFGGYSGKGGIQTKQFLLELEQS